MKTVILICALALGATLSPLRAGFVVSVSDGRETTGKVSFGKDAIQVDTGLTPTTFQFSEILEADFGNDPFQLNFYSSHGTKGKDLPPAWKGQDIGEVDTPGSITFNDGVFSVIASGSYNHDRKTTWAPTDHLFFAGQPWTGDGQWIVRLKDVDAQSPGTCAGLMIRTSFDPGCPSLRLESSALGAGLVADRDGRAYLRPLHLSITPPVWLRFTRYGISFYATVSTDRQHWDLVHQADFKDLVNPWVGFYAYTSQQKELGKANIDEVSFGPAPSSAVELPPGVILQGGSFVAAVCAHLLIDPTNPDALGNFTRGTTPLNIAASQIAAITSIPLARSQIADLANAKPGLIMKNGDVMDGDTNSINNGAVVVNSVLLGITGYQRTDTRACVLHALHVQPAKYEIRLKDGSMIHANDVSASGTTLSIEDVSGAKILATLDDVAQFRAGSQIVQSLSELDWKVKTNPVPTKAAPPAAPAPAAAPAIAPAPPIADPSLAPVVGSWRGPDQQQVLQVATGTTIDFPLTEKYRAVAMRVMVSSDSASTAQAIIHVLADGKEVGTSPPFRAGDQPRFVQVTLNNTSTLSIAAESPFDNTKILLIDPVAIRN